MKNTLLIIWIIVTVVYSHNYINGTLNTTRWISTFAILLLITFIAAAMEQKHKEQ